MSTIPALLIAASALLIFFLGTMHLVLTYRGPAFEPRDPSLLAAMQADSPRISRGTTMWRSLVGFHGSHSLGAMFFGVMYAYLALAGTEFLFGSMFLLTLGLVVLCSYLVLAKRYWFKVPFRGIGVATVLYVAGLLAMW